MTPKATEAGPEMTWTNVTVDFRRFIKDFKTEDASGNLILEEGSNEELMVAEETEPVVLLEVDVLRAPGITWWGWGRYGFVCSFKQPVLCKS